jgi:hypothetical protein
MADYNRIYKLSAFENELAKYPSLNDCLIFQPGLSFLNAFYGTSFDLSKYKNQIDKIGQFSANGFIRKLKYEDGKIQMNVVLKSNKAASNDSLYYEYLAGKCINEMTKYYPFFSRTFELGEYISDSAYNLFQSISGSTTISSPLSSYIKYLDQSNFDSLITESCRNAKRINLFTQFITIKQSLYDYFMEYKEKSTNYFNKTYQTHLTKHIALLFMVFGCLYKLSNYFTHYDLHMDNIVLYSIPNSQYIDVEAKTENGVISFKTKYLPVLIDYGRSYFNCSAIESGLVNSPQLMKKVCLKDSRGSNECPQYCGNDVGYSFTGDYMPATDSFKRTGKNDYYINRSRRNMSHDLRCLAYLKERMKFNQLDSSISWIRLWKQLINDITYETNYDKFGMPELTSEPGEISNVSDVFESLKKIMMEPEYTAHHGPQFLSSSSYGKLVVDFSQTTMQPFQFTKSQ